MPEKTDDELSVTPIPVSLCWGEMGKKSGLKLNPGRTKGRRKDLDFKIWVYFSLSCSDLIVN